MKKKSNFNKFLLLQFGELISSACGGLPSFGLSVYIFNITGRTANMALVMLLLTGIMIYFIKPIKELEKNR